MNRFILDPNVRTILVAIAVFLGVLSGTAFARDTLYFYPGKNNSWAAGPWDGTDNQLRVKACFDSPTTAIENTVFYEFRVNGRVVQKSPKPRYVIPTSVGNSKITALMLFTSLDGQQRSVTTLNDACSISERNRDWSYCGDNSSNAQVPSRCNTIRTAPDPGRNNADVSGRVVNFEKLKISYYDDAPYIGINITFSNPSINGQLLKPKFTLDLDSRYDTRTTHAIGLRNTFSKFLDRSVSHKEQPGNFFITDDNASELRRLYNYLGDNDRLLLKAACGKVQDKAFVKSVVEYVNNELLLDHQKQLKSIFSSNRNLYDINRIARNCLRSLPSSKVTFVQKGDERTDSLSAPKPKAVAESSSCNQNRGIIRTNQRVLKDLGFYTAEVDGLAGPNYRRAVRSGEQLLGTRADDKVGCLNPPERRILSSIYDASRKGSNCKSLLFVAEVKTTFEQLKASDLTKKSALEYANVGGLIWMIDTISDLERRLLLTGFYKVTKTSQRDCRLDRDEFDALAPKEPVNVLLAAKSLSMATLEADNGPTLRFIARGSNLETSKMSKNVFGGSNELSMDVRFSTFERNPVLDFVISEEETKISLRLFGSNLANQTVAASMHEFLLDDKSTGRSAFYIRMFSDGSTNIGNGDFAKIVTKMSVKDKAMVAALCAQLGKVSSSSEGFEASFAAPTDRAAFRRSNFSSEPVREAIASLAKQCVDEIRTKGLVIASFDFEAQMPVCSAAQNQLLFKLDTEIDEAQTALQDFEDEIKSIQVNRPLLERDACPAYETELAAAREKLSAVASEIVSARTSLTDLEAKLAEAEDIKVSLSKISQPSELCDIEKKGLKEQIAGFIQSLNPAGVGVVCPDDTIKSPIQIVIDEINAEITRLLETHISPDQIAELKRTIAQLETERVELAANLAAVTQKKASPVEVDQQMQINAGLSDTLSEIEDQITVLENEISGLLSVMDNNASLISEIDQLNQELVNLTSQKMLTQGLFEDVKSEVLQAKANVTELELQIDKVKSQTSDLEVQLGAASSTAGILQKEVQTLTLDVAQTQKRIESLEEEVAIAEDLIDNANSVIASNSQAVAKLDTELKAKNAEMTTLKTLVDTLGPQADAAEQTVRDMEAELNADFVPIAQHREQEARLNKLTQTVTERTKLIRELRDDLQAIQSEEQLLVEMCLADAQCKAVMGDRLGVE